jgi:predicted RNA binding protein YcfA (HicA-like mRNA interferase family)
MAAVLRAVPRELRDLVKAAIAAGWTLTQSRGNCHLHLRSPQRRLVVVASSTRSKSSHHRLRGDLRRAGLPID